MGRCLGGDGFGLGEGRGGECWAGLGWPEEVEREKREGGLVGIVSFL